MKIGDKIERIIFGINMLSVVLFIFGGYLPEYFVFFYPLNYWKFYLFLCLFTSTNTILKSEYTLIKMINFFFALLSILLYVSFMIYEADFYRL